MKTSNKEPPIQALNQGPVGQQVNIQGGIHSFNIDAPRIEPRKANLPPRPGRFVGRETDLARIHECLLRGAPVALEQRAAKPGGLTGLGGIGKTTLACEYAHQHLHDFEHICWVNASGADLSVNFSALADDPLRLDLGPTVTVPQRIVAVKQRLEQGAASDHL